MTLRPAPSTSSRVVALDFEIVQEQTSALGRLGRALETALAALAQHDRENAENRAVRTKLVQNAGGALWCFIVQREALGLRDRAPGHLRLSGPGGGAKPHGRLRRPPPRVGLSLERRKDRE
jgi:hypothetical protein